MLCFTLNVWGKAFLLTRLNSIFNGNPCLTMNWNESAFRWIWWKSMSHNCIRFGSTMLYFIGYLLNFWRIVGRLFHLGSCCCHSLLMYGKERAKYFSFDSFQLFEFCNLQFLACKTVAYSVVEEKVLIWNVLLIFAD